MTAQFVNNTLIESGNPVQLSKRCHLGEMTRLHKAVCLAITLITLLNGGDLIR